MVSEAWHMILSLDCVEDFCFIAEFSKAEALLPQANKNIKPYLKPVKSLSTQDLIFDQMVWKTPHQLL